MQKKEKKVTTSQTFFKLIHRLPVTTVVWLSGNLDSATPLPAYLKGSFSVSKPHSMLFIFPSLFLKLAWSPSFCRNSQRKKMSWAPDRNTKGFAVSFQSSSQGVCLVHTSRAEQHTVYNTQDPKDLRDHLRKDTWWKNTKNKTNAKVKQFVNEMITNSSLRTSCRKKTKNKTY